MLAKLLYPVESTVNRFLIKESPAPAIPLNNFAHVKRDLQMGDVILVEGRSRVSRVIKYITQSQWSHSALYIGSVSTIEDVEMRKHLARAEVEDEEEPLVVESLLGDGMVITPLETYAKDNLRVCRPTGITKKDAIHVGRYCTSLLGVAYDVRQMLDLARFLFPYGIVPRRWRSSLFVHNAGGPTRTVCSTVIARAFMEVRFPILPVVQIKKNGEVYITRRNPKLFTPRDFDYSPYFSIIKHPFIELPRTKFSLRKEQGTYRDLPWVDSEETFDGGSLLSENYQRSEA